MENVRLQKFLAEGGVASRRKAEKLILAGRVKVNGEKIIKLGTKVDPAKDKVEFAGRIVEPGKTKTVIMLNKPAEYVCTTRRFKGQKNIFDLVKTAERLYSVGRLDKDSLGLILLTNDGALALKLTHPRFQKEKEYEVRIEQNIDPAALERLARGVMFDGQKTAPAKVKQLTQNEFLIILKEGRKRQIRKMCEKFGWQVTHLKRTRVNRLKLGDLAPGKYRTLNKNEIARLS